MKIENRQSLYTEYEKRFIRFFQEEYPTGKRLPLSTQKSFSKWRKALNPKNDDSTRSPKRGFRATVSNLELLCKTASVSPNQILLPREMWDMSVYHIEFVDRSTVIELCESIRRDPPSNSFYLPIIYSPLRMILLYAHIDCSPQQRRIVYWITVMADQPTGDNPLDHHFTESYQVPEDPLHETEMFNPSIVAVYFAKGKGWDIVEAYDYAVSYYKMCCNGDDGGQDLYAGCAAEVAKILPVEKRHGKLFELCLVDKMNRDNIEPNDQGFFIDELFHKAENCTDA